MNYAYEHGDPRKIYHGMDYLGNLCGVDYESQPYVYWCAKDAVALGNWTPITDIDLHHPICVGYCPVSPETQSLCYDEATKARHNVTDYATHPVGKRHCLPQDSALLEKVNNKLNAHPFEKYVPLIVTTFRESWPCLLGSFGLAFTFSSVYVFALQCMAGLILWICLTSLVLFPSIIGGNLIYIAFEGGVDGIPHSGDAQTDLFVGIFCCLVACFFLLVNCCMSRAIRTATRTVEAAAGCLFHAQSLLVEPVLNLVARVVMWSWMIAGLAWLVSVGDVRKSKVYRTFTYKDEEIAFLIFYCLMMLWLNDLCNAVSQYVIANATAKWYFTERVGGVKLIPSCLLCRGYSSAFTQFGSLAFGSFVIALTRPLRIIILALVYAGDVTDGGALGCISKACSCCQSCFESVLQHLSKNAYIDMAITSADFCTAGKHASKLLRTENKVIATITGATWLFTLGGLAFVTAFGGFVTSCVVQNSEVFSSPNSEHYIEDPMVLNICAAIISFIVALCFMLVFDSVADTMLICLAYDLKDRRENPHPVIKSAPEPQQQSVFASFFGTKAEEASTIAPKRPEYAHDKLTDLLDDGE